MTLALLAALPHGAFAAPPLPIPPIPPAGGAAGAGSGGTGDPGCTLPANETQTCTNHAFFNTDNPCYLNNKVEGVLHDIIIEVYTAVQNAAKNLYNAIAGDANFQLIVGASFTLFIIFFAVAFMFGFVQLTLGQGLFRLIKIGVVVWVISPFGWRDFNNIVVKFFNDGSTDLINKIVTIAAPDAGIAAGDIAGPFKILDKTINVVFSPRMLVTLIATFTTTPYGPLVGLALFYAIMEFVKAMLKALLVYSLSIIAKALLFGLAPIFFVFLLFDRTKNLFQGWVNQLVNFSLQPILMFAFLAFFAVMIETSAKQILQAPGTNVCWTKRDNSGSSPFDLQNWAFVCPDGTQFHAYQGMWGPKGAINCPGQPETFPLSIINILIFLLLVHLASQMIDVVTTLAGEMSQGVTRLDQIGGSVSEWFKGRSESLNLDPAIRNPGATVPRSTPHT